MAAVFVPANPGLLILVLHVIMYVYVSVYFFYSQACVVFISTLGGAWLEAHFPTLLSLLMELVCDARVSENLAEAVYCRRCVSYILRASVGSLLGEKAQIAVAQELCLAISKQKKTLGKLQEQFLSNMRACS